MEADVTDTIREPTVMTDEEWNAARREAMGDDYPGDEEMRRRDAEDDAAMQQWAEQQRNEPAAPAAAPATEQAQAPKEWNAHDWVQDAFRDDPNFGQLSEEDRGRLATMADEKHAQLQADVQEWAKGRADEWGHDLHDKVVEGLDANASTADFVHTRLADGDFSADDRAALEQAVTDMTPAEQMHLVRPLVEELHQINGDVYDGAEMIVDHAIDDVKDIVDARADMPGGDSAEVHKMQDDLEAAPAQVHDAIDFMRQSDEADYVKVEHNMDAIEAGADPHSLHDSDTWQVDDHADEHATAEA